MNLLIDLQDKDNSDVLIYMKEFIDFDTHMHKGRLFKSYTPDERANILLKDLQELQKRSQAPILKTLKTQYNIHNVESFWISNSLIIRNLEKSVIFGLSMRSDVDRIILEENPKVDPIEEASTKIVTEENKTQVERNIAFVKAPAVWAQGFEGQGMTVGVLDTGLVHNHPAIINSYRGNLGNGRFNHDYNWRGSSRTPVDAHGHGTHCSGTVAGGVDRKIGVAPKAKLIHCHGLVRGIPVTACLQWFLAPTRVDGSNPDTSKRPHVTSHSYRSGATYDREYRALLSAGVHVVNSGGNGGPRCSTVNANTRTKGQISVAAQNVNSHTVARFSAKGPSTIRGLVRPYVAAPGVSVVSAAARGGYTSMSGTSMSCPNVAGGVALLWSAVPELARDIEKTNKVFEQSSRPNPTTECNRSGDPQHPNHITGWGTVDYQKAVSAAKAMFPEVYGKKKNILRCLQDCVRRHLSWQEALALITMCRTDQRCYLRNLEGRAKECAQECLLLVK